MDNPMIPSAPAFSGAPPPNMTRISGMIIQTIAADLGEAGRGKENL
jgi:hypothetical protein